MLCLSERYHHERGLRHKRLTDWARQGLLQLRRWLPERRIVAVCDSSFAALDLLAAVREHVTVGGAYQIEADVLYAVQPGGPALHPGAQHGGRRHFACFFPARATAPPGAGPARSA
ncbi:MAG: hypothetical protein AAF624_01235 [Bacteroidota bacterium]